jgi:hypothetical protein
MGINLRVVVVISHADRNRRFSENWRKGAVPYWSGWCVTEIFDFVRSNMTSSLNALPPVIHLGLDALQNAIAAFPLITGIEGSFKRGGMPAICHNI